MNTRKSALGLAGALAFLAAGMATADVVVENTRMKLVIGDDAVAKSLTIKANGEEMLDVHERLPLFQAVQDRPFNNEIKLVFPHTVTAFRADRIRREGDFLIVGFELVSYSAKIRVTERDGYVLFELVDFILGPKGTDHLRMTYPPVSSVRILNLPVRNRAHIGDWMNSVWDEKAAVALMSAEPYTWIAGERRDGFRLMSADARRDLRLRGAKAALIAAPTGEFLDCVDAMEREQDLPRGVESRRSAAMNRSTYWTHDICPTNVDAHIAYAKKGGFRQMLIYYMAVCKGAQGDKGYAGIGDYEIEDSYPKGYDSLREMLAKIKAAGITPGLHVLHTFIGLKTHYVTPVADPRLNLTRHFTLAKAVGEEGGDLYVQEDPSTCPTNAESRVLAFGGELMSYEGFTTSYPFKFTGVRRGHCATRVVAHDRGQIGGILDICEYGAQSCYIDQDSDLQDEVAEKIAKVYDCGFEFMYYDGSEGASEPQGIQVANAQYRVWRKLAKKPIFTEGAAKCHFAWHHLSAANAFDVFQPEVFEAMIVRWPQYEAPIIAADFSRPDFGWWGIYLPGEELKLRDDPMVKTVGTQPDMWEFGTSRAAAWDAPVSVQMILEKARRHPRMDDLLEVMRRWEDVRARKGLTAEQKAALKSQTQHHHLYLNEKGGYELLPIEVLPTPVQAKDARAFLFARNGRRVLAVWHTTGEGTLKLTLDGKPVQIRLGNLQYVETPMAAAEVKNAFAAAEL